MNQKPIAILSNNWAASIEWLRKTRKIITINAAQKTLWDDCDQMYKIVNRLEDITAHEFSSYMRAPDFWTLEDKIKERIR